MKLTIAAIMALKALAASPSADVDIRAHAYVLTVLGYASPHDLPFLGLALSRASADPEACKLLRELAPSSVCVK